MREREREACQVGELQILRVPLVGPKVAGGLVVGVRRVFDNLRRNAVSAGGARWRWPTAGGERLTGGAIAEQCAKTRVETARRLVSCTERNLHPPWTNAPVRLSRRLRGEASPQGQSEKVEPNGLEGTYFFPSRLKRDSRSTKSQSLPRAAIVPSSFRIGTQSGCSAIRGIEAAFFGAFARPSLVVLFDRAAFAAAEEDRRVSRTPTSTSF